MSFKSLMLMMLVLVSGGARMAESEESTDVVVVGGGVAGLVAAYELKKRGLRSRVIEARPMVGGRAGTADYGDGLRAEYGLQEIWAGNPLVGIARELGLELELGYQHCAHSTFMSDGKIYPDLYDGTMRAHWESFLSAAEVRALEDWLAAARRLHERAHAQGLADPQIRSLQDISFADWLRAAPQLGHLARAWLRLHMEAELASDWHDVSALFALLEMGILFDGGAACFSLDGGYRVLLDALAREVDAVTTSATVTSVRRLPDPGAAYPLQVAYLKMGRMQTIGARRVVLAVPFYGVHRINIEPSLPPAYHRALGMLRPSHYLVVHLLMNSADTAITMSDGTELPDVLLTNGPLGYVYGVVSESRDRAVFSMLLYGEHARGFHMAPRDVKLRELFGHLDELQPGFSAGVRDAYVYAYHPAALAAWGPGRSPLDEHSRLLREPVNGIHLAGDYTLGAHSDAAARSGVEAASRIAFELDRATTMTSLARGCRRGTGDATNAAAETDLVGCRR